MPDSRAQTFVDALHRLEDDGDAGAIVDLFASDAELTNPNIPDSLHGPEGAREFWQTYRSTFGTIRSEFHHVLESDRAALLEWTSRGTGSKGEEIRYDGVTVLEFGNEGIRRFRAYFDPADLGNQLQPER